MSNRRKQALGRGLGALLGERGGVSSSATATATGISPAEAESIASEALEAAAESIDAELKQIPLNKITPNPRQPRQNFEPEPLEELAESIRHHGVLQPILVCNASEPGEYIVLAGERRVRASEIAGRETIPARLIEATEVEQLEFAIIENVQRESLDPVEEARGYQQLASAFGYSQEQIAERVGKSRVAVANSLRLLKLPEGCLRDLQNGLLSPGHARAILMLPHPLQQEHLRKTILDKNFSVREAEAAARKTLEGGGTASAGSGKKNQPEVQQNLDVVAVQESLILELGCKVVIKERSASSGTIEIQYKNLDDFDRVLQKLGIDLDES